MQSNIVMGIAAGTELNNILQDIAQGGADPGVKDRSGLAFPGIDDLAARPFDPLYDCEPIKILLLQPPVPGAIRRYKIITVAGGHCFIHPDRLGQGDDI